MSKHRFMVPLLFVALAFSGIAYGAAPNSGNPIPTAQYPLVGDDGRAIGNHSAVLDALIEHLPGVVTVANPGGKVTLVEFYDLNGPYERGASSSIEQLVQSDSQVKLVLFPSPILGRPSIAAGRVELALAKLGTPQQFYSFHRSMFAERGTIDGLRALAAAQELGFSKADLIKLGNSEEITQTMKLHVVVGSALGLDVTPSFIIADVAILGYPGERALRAIVDAAEKCGKVVC